MSKLCPYCKSKKVGSFNDTVMCCMECHRVFGKSQLIDATIFDCITASQEVLAEKLVYCSLEEYYKPFSSNKCGMGLVIREEWRSTITGGTYKTKKEAIAATVAKLKEVEG